MTGHPDRQPRHSESMAWTTIETEIEVCWHSPCGRDPLPHTRRYRCCYSLAPRRAPSLANTHDEGWPRRRRTEPCDCACCPRRRRRPSDPPRPACSDGAACRCYCYGPPAPAPRPATPPSPGADGSWARAAVDVVDRTNGPLSQRYGERFVVSLTPHALAQDIIELLAPDRRRYKVAVRWWDGVSEELDAMVQVDEIRRFAKQLEIKERKRVRWV